jgi:hypothetical protein
MGKKRRENGGMEEWEERREGEQRRGSIFERP